MILTHALSVQQPWARALLVQGPRRKPLENRYNVRAIDRPPFPVPSGWLGLHAGLAIHGAEARCLGLCPEAAEPPIYERGALIGAVHVVGWVRASEALRDPLLAPWVMQPTQDELDAERERRRAKGDHRPIAREGWCLVTDAARTIPPIRMRGMLGRFALAEEVVIDV